jgi:hypothetical protein
VRCCFAALQFEQYFTEAAELEAVRALLDGAALAHTTSHPTSSSSTPASLQTHSSNSSAAADDEAWVRFYAGEHAERCLDILAAWIPDTFAASFRQLHEVRLLLLLVMCMCYFQFECCMRSFSCASCIPVLHALMSMCWFQILNSMQVRDTQSNQAAFEGASCNQAACCS